MPEPKYELLSENEQRELAKKVLKDLELQTFLSDVRVTASEGNLHVPMEAQKGHQDRHSANMVALDRARTKYKSLLAEPSKEESSA